MASRAASADSNHTHNQANEHSYRIMGSCMSAVDEEMLKKLQPQFDALKLRRSEVRRLYRIFMKVDVDRSGSVELKELMDFLDMGETVFKDRVFSIFDEDGSGQIDFREFVLSLWNYCTLSKATLDLFAFDLYDKDSNGELSSKEVEEMLRDLYGAHFLSNPMAKAVAQELKKSAQESAIDINKFQAFVKYHPALLFPAFQEQHGLRRRVLGEGFWERASSRRIELSNGRFVPISNLVELNVNAKLYATQTGAGDVQHGARYVLQNTGTIHYRQKQAALVAEADSEKTVSLHASHKPGESHPPASSSLPSSSMDGSEKFSTLRVRYSPEEQGMESLNRAYQQVLREQRPAQLLDSHPNGAEREHKGGLATATDSFLLYKPSVSTKPSTESHSMHSTHSTYSHKAQKTEERSSRRHSVGGSSKKDGEKKAEKRYGRRNSLEDHNLSSELLSSKDQLKGERDRKSKADDVRKQLHEKLAKRVANVVLVDDKNSSFYDRRNTAPY